MTDLENPLFVCLYGQIVEKVLAETANVEEANQKLRELGKEMGSHLYLTTAIADKTKDNIVTREDVSKLVESLFKILFNRKPTDIDMESTRGSIRVSDEKCLFCQGVNLEGMRGFGYCEVFSGILESILEFKGVESSVFQELSRALGADECVWNVRLV
jgi:predicted hydrocarbon binding protein